VMAVAIVGNLNFALLEEGKHFVMEAPPYRKYLLPTWQVCRSHM
jgi:hypothetical protein